MASMNFGVTIKDTPGMGCLCMGSNFVCTKGVITSLYRCKGVELVSKRTQKSYLSHFTHGYANHNNNTAFHIIAIRGLEHFWSTNCVEPSNTEEDKNGICKNCSDVRRRICEWNEPSVNHMTMVSTVQPTTKHPINIMQMLIKARERAIQLSDNGTGIHGFRWNEEFKPVMNYCLDLYASGGALVYNLVRGGNFGAGSHTKKLYDDSNFNIFLPSLSTVRAHIPVIQYEHGVSMLHFENFMSEYVEQRDKLAIEGKNYSYEIICAYDEVHARRQYSLKMVEGKTVVYGCTLGIQLNANQIKDINTYIPKNMANQIMVFTISTTDGLISREVAFLQTCSATTQQIKNTLFQIKHLCEQKGLTVAIVTGDCARANVSLFDDNEISRDGYLCLPDYVHLVKNLRNNLLDNNTMLRVNNEGKKTKLENISISYIQSCYENPNDTQFLHLLQSDITPSDRMAVQPVLDFFSLKTQEALKKSGHNALAEYMSHSLNIYNAMDVKRTGKLHWESEGLRETPKLRRPEELSLEERVKLLEDAGRYFEPTGWKKGLTELTQKGVNYLCKNMVLYLKKKIADGKEAYVKPRMFGTNVVESFFSTLRARIPKFTCEEFFEMVSLMMRVHQQRRNGAGGYVFYQNTTNNHTRVHMDDQLEMNYDANELLSLQRKRKLKEMDQSTEASAENNEIPALKQILKKINWESNQKKEETIRGAFHRSKPDINYQSKVKKEKKKEEQNPVPPPRQSYCTSECGVTFDELGKPSIQKGDMFACRKCTNWYHLECLGLPKSSQPVGTRKWYCPKCLHTGKVPKEALKKEYERLTGSSGQGK